MHFNMDSREGLYTRAGANGFAEWFYVTGKEWVKGFVKNSAMDWRGINLSDLRAAIDSFSNEITTPCAASDYLKKQAQINLQNNESAIITAKLNPTKCRKIDPALAYDEHCKCGKPVEWLDIYCQECWEQHSAVLPTVLVRPDEAEILPAPCATCAVKDHDLTVLRKLLAGNLSTYAKRVHSQQTHILIYEVIIGALIVACVILFLWGLK